MLFNIECNEQDVNECKKCINYDICYNTEEEDWDADFKYHVETFDGIKEFNG